MFDLETMRDKVNVFDRLLSITQPEEAHIRLTSDAWTLTEIVGHLVDSASNNHQRFARLRMGDLDSFPGYEAEAWVKAQDYDGFDFAALAGLWRQYNAFLLHLAATTPETAAGNTWTSEGKTLTLESLVNDYYEHLSLHMEQYAQRLGEVRNSLPSG